MTPLLLSQAQSLTVTPLDAHSSTSCPVLSDFYQVRLCTPEPFVSL